MKSIRVALFAGLLAAANASAAAPGPVSGPANDPTSGPLHGHTAETTGDAGDWVAPVLEEFLVTARVVDGSGRPVEGAVVVTAVGGKGVSDADGLVRMRVQMDPAADRLRVTAYHTAAGDTWTGSTIAAAAGAVIDAGEIPVVMKSGCEPGWEPTFGSAVGFDGDVNALAVFDDGSGPKLYAGGQFRNIGFADVNGLAVWDGAYWKRICEDWHDNSQNTIHGLHMVNNGSSEELYVVGSFRAGDEHYSFARWDGSEWIRFPTPSSINALTYFDNGDGPKLYAGGSIGSSVSLHRWDGNVWQPLTASQSGLINALTIFDDGAGARLYVAGRFNAINGVPANSIAAWDGSAFSALDGGVTVPSGNSTVNALKVLDLGTGPKLYVGGNFTAAGGAESNYIAAWNGAAWESIGADLLDPGSAPGVNLLSVITMNGTTALAVSGRYGSQSDPEIDGLAAWDGQSWTRLGGVQNLARAMVEYYDGARTGLIVGGYGVLTGQYITRGLAGLYDGVWESLGGDLRHYLTSMAVFDDGSGPTPYATIAADRPEDSLLRRWNGERWEEVGGPVAHQQTFGAELRVLNDGSGDRLYLCGRFWTPTGFQNNIAIWDGHEFEYLPFVTNSDIWAVEMFDDGSGPALHIGTAGLFRLDGAAWTDLGVAGGVFALRAFDDGSGQSLYAGGNFTRASTVLGTRNFARWDGSEWHAMGEGFLQEVRAIEMFDDGTGPAIYAAGRFQRAINGIDSPGIAKWDGTAWAPLGSGIIFAGGLPDVRGLTAFDDGGVMALYASGYMSVAGGQQTIAIARWDGRDWSALSPQIQPVFNPSFLTAPIVRSTTVWNDNEGSSLLVAGRFYLPATGEQHAARWRACPPACIPDLNGDGVVDADDFFLFLQLFAAGDLQADINNDGVIDADDFFAYLGLFAAGC